MKSKKRGQMPICCCNTDDEIVADKRSEEETQRAALRRCTPPALIRQRVVEVPVRLNVYSLLKQNRTLVKFGMGIYHCGVVVYGFEWGYGEAIDPSTASGLFHVYPGQAAGTLHRTIFLGVTTLSPQQVDTVLHRLENEWRSAEYHILDHNCNHFAQRFCDLLSTVQKLRIPQWCNRAARVCSRIVPNRLASYIHRLVDEEPPRAPPPSSSNVGEIPRSVIPRNWYLHPSLSQQPRYTATPTDLQEHLRFPGVPASEGLSNDNMFLSGGSESYSPIRAVYDSTTRSAGASHRDPSSRSFSESGGRVSRESPFPFRHNMGEADLGRFAGDSSPCNDADILFSPLQSDDREHRVERISARLRRLAPQLQPQHILNISGGEEENGVLEKIFGDSIKGKNSNGNKGRNSSKGIYEESTGNSGSVALSSASVTLGLKPTEKDEGVFEHQKPIGDTEENAEGGMDVGYADCLRSPSPMDPVFTANPIGESNVQEHQRDEERNYKGIADEESRDVCSVPLPSDPAPQEEEEKDEEKQKETDVHATSISSEAGDTKRESCTTNFLEQLFSPVQQTHTTISEFALYMSFSVNKKNLKPNFTANTPPKLENEVCKTDDVKCPDGDNFSENVAASANGIGHTSARNGGHGAERTPLEGSEAAITTADVVFSDPSASGFDDDDELSPVAFTARTGLISPTPEKCRASSRDWLLNPLQRLYERKRHKLCCSWPP